MCIHVSSEPTLDAGRPEDARSRALHHAALLPDYEPFETVRGEISLWGHGSFKHEFMGRLVGTWLAEFNRFHPDVALDYRMYGTASAIGALYSGAGNLAILGEEISPAALRAFRRARGYSPTGVTIATGSVRTNFFDYAHMVFKHRSNPLAGLTVQQLDGIFGTECRQGGPLIRTWGELGLGGEWAHQRIRLHSWRTDVDFALFFSERILRYSHRWNPGVAEYVHATREDGSQYDHGEQILDALARDRYALAISNIRYAGPQVSLVPLAWGAGEPFCVPTIDSLVSRAYPLTRVIPAYVDRDPTRPFPQPVGEFLRFILSRQGQTSLVLHSGYLPVSPRAQAQEMEVLAA